MPDTPPLPTDQERRNSAVRAVIAARQQAEWQACVALAEQALGPGWQPWMKLSLIPTDHRQTGDDTPVAVAYKVRRGRGDNRDVRYVRAGDGQVLCAERYEDVFGALLAEPHPTRTVAVKGQRVPVSKYELYWSPLERYVPRSAEELALLRQGRQRKRQERADAAWARDNPLLVYLGYSRQQWEKEQEQGRTP
jgi:hypothetical protein